MTDETSKVAAEDISAVDSQVIENRETDVDAQGRGVHLPEDETQKDDKPLSTRDAIAKAFDDSEKAAKEKGEKAAEDAQKKAEEAKEADKGEDKDDKKAEEVEKTEKAKPQRGEDGKFSKQAAEDVEDDKGAPDKAATERSAPEDRQSEGRKYSEPPARFLPEAREKWANVPTAVKADFHRIMQEIEQDGEKNKHAVERYEAIREYDEIAKQNGRDLKDSLARINQVENALKQNPIAGLDAVLREIGPRKHDGTPLTLQDVANYITQNPQAYQQMARSAPMQQQAQPHQQQSNSEIEQLRAEIQTMKVQPVIQSFAQSHPDFHTLENQIAEILQSGVIEKIYGTSLSPEQKLTEAYRMAGGRTSSSQSEPEHSRAPKDRPVDPDGQKSINGAPTAGKTKSNPKRFKTNREALEAAFSAS